MCAVSVDLTRRRVDLADGSSLRYRRLVVATGSCPRTLPPLDGYENVSVLRSVDDCLALREVLASQPRLTVIGAGFIGQEVAATARQLGAEVAMIEAAPAPLISLLGPRLGDWFVRLHRAAGVEVLTSWLADSGIASPAGVPVDPDGRTPVDGLIAIGDAAATFDPIMGGHVSGSHWEAAGRQATRAARVILGLDPGPAQLASFWTDQYGIRIQYLGHARLADSVRIDGDPSERSFTATFLRAGDPVGALVVGRPRALPAFRNLIEKGTP